mmetsp:Transcript_5522/g.9857  ORF Transcript_5522/g.9857 Transcript_5522/m.9857 type:complete len:107 (-) Transcript_5522:1195-1515(-)
MHCMCKMPSFVTLLSLVPFWNTHRHTLDDVCIPMFADLNPGSAMALRQTRQPLSVHPQYRWNARLNCISFTLVVVNSAYHFLKALKVALCTPCAPLIASSHAISSG